MSHGRMNPESITWYGCTVEEAAAILTEEEGRVVTVQEVRMLEAQGLRKLRKVLAARGLRFVDLVPSR